jgi:hypothetical protein
MSVHAYMYVNMRLASEYNPWVRTKTLVCESRIYKYGAGTLPIVVSSSQLQTYYNLGGTALKRCFRNTFHARQLALLFNKHRREHARALLLASIAFHFLL